MEEEKNKFDILLKCTGFDWDKHNSNKNWIKHRVSSSECEQVFFNVPLLISDDTEHSFIEKRYYALGSTDGKKYLFIVFTIRNQKIRVISARDMNRIEKKGKNMTTIKKIPKFKDEAQERIFWATHDSTEYINWKEAKKVVLPNLKPSMKAISIRLPESMIEELKLLANKKDVPYQSLLKIFLAERIGEEMHQN